MTAGRYAVAFLAGAAAVAAFSPVEFYPVALVSAAVLVHLWSTATPREGFLSGLWFGLGLFGAGVSWSYVSLHQFGGMPPLLAALGTLGFCAILAVFGAGAGWLQARIPASPLVRATLVIPACWTLFEWLRSWVLTGCSWLSFGYATTGWPLQGYAPVLGVFAASFATVSLAGLGWRFVVAGEKRSLLLVPIAAILLAGEALHRVEWTTPYGVPVSTALLQGNVGQEMKFDPERYARTLETYAKLVEGTSARLVVLPETAVPRMHDRVDPAYFERLEKAVLRNRGDLLLGIPYQGGRGQYYNSVLTFGASPRQVYHKVHLVPFGEFIPPGFGWIIAWLKIPLGDFARGGLDQPPIVAAGHLIGVTICYEDAFGDEVARWLPRATFLVNMSNMAWFGDSLAPGQHLQMARLRSLETGRTLLAATNTGITAAIDHKGRVIARLPQSTEGRLEVMAQGYQGATPYVRFRDWPMLAACLLILVALTVRARSR